MSKRQTPDTMFKAIGPETTQSSSSSPGTVQPAIEDGVVQGDPPHPHQATQGMAEHHVHQSMHLNQMQVNQVQIDPAQLEALLGELVSSKVAEHVRSADEQVRAAREFAQQAHEQRLRAESMMNEMSMQMQRMREEAQEFQAQAMHSAQASAQYAQEQVLRDRMSAEAEIQRVRGEADRRIAEIASRTPPPVPSTSTPAASRKGGMTPSRVPDWKEELARAMRNIVQLKPVEVAVPQTLAPSPQPHGAEFQPMTLGMHERPAHSEPRPSVPGSRKAESDVTPQRFSIASRSSSESSDPGSDPGDGGSSGGDEYKWPEEKKVYRTKHLKQIVVTKLPTDATTHREWRSAFLACVSKVDMSKDDVLVRYTVSCFDDGRGRRFRDMLQNDEKYIAFNKHVAAELIKQDVLATNPELAHELKTHVEQCAARKQGPKGSALLNIIAAYFETDISRTAALDQMHLLSIQLQGKSAKDLQDFVRKTNYVLHGLRATDRPAEATMFQWLWRQVKRVPILQRVTDRVRESKSSSRRRTFDHLWTCISEELRERRHDANYENLTQGMREKSHPPPTLAVFAVEDAMPGFETKGGKGGSGLGKGKTAEKPSRKLPCRQHAAGECRFGNKCRFAHVGEPGSPEAKKAVEDHKSKETKGGKKGDAKGAKGKKGKDKTAASAAVPSSVAAVAASSVTITEVEAMWKSFVEFAKRALPAMNVFLKLSVPIFASLVSGVMHLEHHAASARIRPVARQFHDMSIELLGDTGAAHDIGSRRALEEQGLDTQTIEAWVKCLENPINFETGGGTQRAEEILELYASSIGELNIHLLENCPLAMSIGRQVAQGRTFVWQPGERPFICLDHKQCTVTCPIEQRWYATRVQHHVPIFAIEPGNNSPSPQSKNAGVSKSNPPTQNATEGSGIAAAADLRQSQASAMANVQSSKPSTGATDQGGVRCQAEFCETCYERAHYCVCATMHDIGPYGYASKEHKARRERKQNRTAAWEGAKEPEKTSSARGAQDSNAKVLIEYCTSEHSMLGVVGAELDIQVVRCTKTQNNVEDPETQNRLLKLIAEYPGTNLWGSLECTAWSQWQNMNSRNLEFKGRLEKAREESRAKIRSFTELAREVVKAGGSVSFEWPRHASGWNDPAVQSMVNELDMCFVDFDGCRVGLVDDNFRPFLKRWRFATTSRLLQKTFMPLKCVHDKGFRHAAIEGQNTARTALYPRMMCELIVTALFRGIVLSAAPAMPVVVQAQQDQHREKDVKESDLETIRPEELVIETVDTLYAAAADSDADSEEEPDASHGDRLRKEAQSLRHLILHDKKNPQCEACQRGRMLKRYTHSVRPYEEDEIKVETFGDLIEADHMFPSTTSLGLAGEKAALVIRDRYSGVVAVYPMSSRAEENNYEALKHFAGLRLNGVTTVNFRSDAATELQAAAGRLCWNTSSSLPDTFPHNAHVEREIRTIKELSRPSHLQAGFHRRLWTVTVKYVSQARTFWSPAPVYAKERDTEPGNAKLGKTRWEVMTGSKFPGPKYPLGALVFYRAKNDGMSEPTTKPGLFAGWKLESGMKFRDSILVLDYEATRHRTHLHWVPKAVHCKEVFFPDVTHLEFPLAKAARNALANMSDPDHEARKRIYDRSLLSGVLPYEVDVDAFPVEEKPTPDRHAYITWDRLMKHGHTRGCAGCMEGHSRHNAECRRKFDELYKKDTTTSSSSKGPPPLPAPAEAPPTPGPSLVREMPDEPSLEPRPCAPERDILDEDEDDLYAPGTPIEDPLPAAIARGCDEAVDDGEKLFAAVTRQLSRAEIMGREDALRAIQKEFDGIGAMGAWRLDSVREEDEVRAEALRENKTIHLADLLAICSEKNVELEPSKRSLKGRVCYRGDAARDASGNLALYQTLSASPASIVAANATIAFGMLENHKVTSADAVKAYLQALLKSLAKTWIRLPRQVWPSEWLYEDGSPRYRKPVIELLQALYGHPEAGSHWQQQFEEAIKKHMNAVPIEEYPSTFLFPDFGGLCLCIYVDDFILAGKSEHHERFWKVLGDHIKIDDVGDLGRFLGRHHCTIDVHGQARFAFDMREYARTIVAEYVAITGVTPRSAVSPFIHVAYTDEPTAGSLAGRASSVLMKLMWLSRLARPDLLRCTCFLARRVNAWSSEEDLLLSRAIGYLNHSADRLLTGSLGMRESELFVEAFCDVDFAGEVDDMYSANGGWIQLTDGNGGFFPLAWLSKKQTAISRSTTEAEVVALSYVLFEEAIDLVELYSQVLGRRVTLKLREDSEACAKVVSTGYSRKLRHLKRTHKVNIAAVKEQLDREDTMLELVNTSRQKADIFTKALQSAKWPAAMELLGIAEDGYTILTSTNTGLKQSVEAGANEALQPDAEVQVQAPAQSAVRKKAKTKGQRAQRIPLYRQDPLNAQH